MDGARGFWFARLSKPVIFLIVVLALIGAYEAFTIPLAIFPETNFPRVVIAVDSGVMPIEQMQVTVTRPIEDAMNSIPGLHGVRSITSRGSAEIDLFFDWNGDMFQTLQLVDAALSRVQSTLPPSCKIDAHRLSFASFPILGYSLTSDNVPQTELWQLATYEIQPRLNRLDGVAKIVVQGGQVPEFQIAPDPAKLQQAGVTINDILEAVRRTNMIDSPGLLQQNHMLNLTLVSGQVHSPEELGQIVIKTTAAGVPVRVADVASVLPSVKPVYTIVTANGKPAVLISVNRQPDGNTVTVADEVAQEVASIRQTLPPGVKLEVFYDQSEIVRRSISSVRDAILLGLILASAILLLFLRDWGSSLVAGLVIPITICISFVALKVLGLTFDLMTLGGLAAAVGLVIDDAIVVVENIVLHRDAGQGRLEAIASALREITVPLIGSTITPVVVFLPLISMAGVTGVFFRALAITMTVALGTSLLLALSWTPALSRIFVRREAPDTHQEPPADRAEELQRLMAAEDLETKGWLGRAIAWYERRLKWCLEHPRWVAVGCAALVLLAGGSYLLLETDLLPELDEGGFIVDYWAPAGSSLEETNRMVSHVEQMARAMPDVESTSRRTGLELGLAAVTEAHRGDITVKLKSSRSRATDEVMADIRHQAAVAEPALKVELVEQLGDMVGDLSNAPEPIRINLYSQDQALLRQWAPRVAEAIEGNGVVDVLNGIENTISGPAILYQVNPAIAARAGFTPEEVEMDAAAMVEGEPAAVPMVLHDRAYTIRVRMKDAAHMSAEQLSNTLLVSGTGHTATLGALANMTEMPGQNEVRRENRQRVVTVTARLEGIGLGSGISQVQKKVAALKLPSGIRVEYGGTYQEQQQSFRDLVRVLLLALLLVFGVLLFEFRSFAAPTAIVAAALLSTAGVFFALLVTHVSFNVASFMGLIMVVGIVAKNGILLLDADARFRALGMSAEDAMILAGRRRIRPILMTAMASVAGMLPLAFALGSGAQMLQPLAIGVIGGITLSMALSLILTPTLHYYLTEVVGRGAVGAV